MIVYTFCPMAVIRWPVLIIQDMSLAGYRTNKPANVESTLLKGKSSKEKRLTERIVFDDKTDGNIEDQTTDGNDEDTGTPTIERRDVFLWWQSNECFFVLVDSVSMVLYGITDVRVPFMDKYGIMHYGYSHAIVEVYTIVVIDVTNDDTIIARSGDGWRNCFTGRTEEQEA